MDTECQHLFQHTISGPKAIKIQYCVDCREIVSKWDAITAKDVRIGEKDQKLANQHKCLSKSKKAELRRMVDCH